jgi:hypothetical protein
MDSGVYRLGEPQLQEGCSGVECAAADVLSSQFVSLTLVTVTLLALVALTYFHRAREECGEEQSRLQAERSALERFESQIRGLSAASVGQSTPSRGGATLAQSNVETRSQLQAVQNAYRDTVMAVPHYQEDYGESLTEHMTAEFGEDVTTAVVEGSTLTPQVKRALVSKASESRKERAAFARTLAAESESVTVGGTRRPGGRLRGGADSPSGDGPARSDQPQLAGGRLRPLCVPLRVVAGDLPRTGGRRATDRSYRDDETESDRGADAASVGRSSTPVPSKPLGWPTSPSGPPRGPSGRLYAGTASTVTPSTVTTSPQPTLRTS